MLENIYLSAAAAIVAYAYCTILIQPGHIMHRPYEWLKRQLTYTFTEKIPIPKEIQKGEEFTFNTYEKEHWLLKPLGGCVFCFGGQLALWSSIFLLIFNPIQIIINICLTITIIKLLTKLN